MDGSNSEVIGLAPTGTTCDSLTLNALGAIFLGASSSSDSPIDGINLGTSELLRLDLREEPKSRLDLLEGTLIDIDSRLNEISSDSCLERCLDDSESCLHDSLKLSRAA